MKKYTRGFTLIELLVVIAIIGILASIVLVSLNSARNKGKDARVISDVQQLRTAFESGYNGTNYTDLVSNATTTAGTQAAATAALSIDIKNQAGTDVVIKTNGATATSYAIYGPLPSTGTTPNRWFCIDSAGGTNQSAANTTNTTCP